ncbi:MAG: DUF4398 domain-containing protein [Steroidobacter sp.]
MIRHSLHNRVHFTATILIGMGGALLLSACASTPEPTLAMSAAEQAINSADRARLADSDSPELSEAHDKLAAAQTAIRAEKMNEARRLAFEARVDAELASAKFATAREQARNDEIRHSTDVLTQEMQRKSGDTQ